MLSFLTAHLAVSGLPSSPVRPTGLSFDPRPKPCREPGHRYGPSSPVRLLCRPHEGCQPVSRPVPWAYILGLWTSFILGTINKIGNLSTIFHYLIDFTFLIREVVIGDSHAFYVSLRIKHEK